MSKYTMQKYIVKNCPACHNYYSNIYECHQLEDCNNNLCKDWTNCLIKQVIEKCKEAIRTYDNEEFYEDDCDRFLGESAMAQEILEELE